MAMGETVVVELSVPSIDVETTTVGYGHKNITKPAEVNARRLRGAIV